MKRFSRKDIATYYNHTILHYKVGWQLKKAKVFILEFGIVTPKNLHEAIINVNRLIAEHIPKDKSLKVLDAGCGIGGTAIYLAEAKGCDLEGITLSNKQCDIGNIMIKEAGLDCNVRLSIQDYTNTNFDDGSFDIIYAIESLCHAYDKSDVYNEAFRLLKPGGKFVFIEYFKSKLGLKKENRKTLDWWLNRWAISDIDTIEDTYSKLKNSGYSNISSKDFTSNISKTVDLMYRKAMLGLITIPLYTILHPGRYEFSRRHPESGWALKQCYSKKLMEYHLFSAIKPK